MINGCKLDDRITRVDWDGGFVEGRQYGRGRSGGQVREEYRTDYDPGRGGWGKAAEGMAPMIGAFGSAQASQRESGGRRESVGGASGEPGAKRSREAEEPAVNPRFRRGKE